MSFWNSLFDWNTGLPRDSKSLQDLYDLTDYNKYQHPSSFKPKTFDFDNKPNPSTQMTLSKFTELLQYLTQDGVDGNFKISNIIVFKEYIQIEFACGTVAKISDTKTEVVF